MVKESEKVKMSSKDNVEDDTEHNMFNRVKSYVIEKRYEIALIILMVISWSMVVVLNELFVKNTTTYAIVYVMLAVATILIILFNLWHRGYCL